MALLADPAVDIGTLAAVIVRDEEKTNPAIVKAIVERADGARTGRAFYFTRTTAPSGEGPLLHHIGLYAYRRAALERYVTLPPSALERREKLEQLRALELGLSIWAAVAESAPISVDTPADLEQARVYARSTR
jgi:3-deoxy-manno-octulosonate cytidylyltransferase (CMP-KDO synthetase)